MKFTALSLTTMFIMAVIFSLMPSCAFKDGDKQIVVDPSAIRILEIVAEK